MARGRADYYPGEGEAPRRRMGRLSTRAALEFHDPTAIASSAIAQLTSRLDDGQRLPRQCVLVVDEAGRLELRLDDGRTRTVEGDYLRDGHLDHGYAITAHRAQGATVGGDGEPGLPRTPTRGSRR